MTQAARATVSCGLPMAPSPPSIRQGSTFTIPQGINAAGAITGFYFDAIGAVTASCGRATAPSPRSMSRAPSTAPTPEGLTWRGPSREPILTQTSSITASCALPTVPSPTFDVPGAVNFYTTPSGINPAGAIAGYYFDANFLYHGFLRAPDGTITTFDPPGSNGLFTHALGGINPGGAITGSYFDANFLFHGFVRAPDGTFIAPIGCAGLPSRPRSPPSSTRLASSRENYFDASGATHGFLRIP